MWPTFHKTVLPGYLMTLLGEPPCQLLIVGTISDQPSSWHSQFQDVPTDCIPLKVLAPLCLCVFSPEWQRLGVLGSRCPWEQSSPDEMYELVLPLLWADSMGCSMLSPLAAQQLWAPAVPGGILSIISSCHTSVTHSSPLTSVSWDPISNKLMALKSLSQGQLLGDHLRWSSRSPAQLPTMPPASMGSPFYGIDYILAPFSHL